MTDAQLQLDLEGSHTADMTFSEWIRSQPPTPWAQDPRPYQDRHRLEQHIRAQQRRAKR